MFQMDIDCIIYSEGTVPEVRCICPDEMFPWKEEDTTKPVSYIDRMHPKMTILNYKDTHFNLVVEGNSMIAQSGTFDFKENLLITKSPNPRSWRGRLKYWRQP